METGLGHAGPGSGPGGTGGVGPAGPSGGLWAALMPSPAHVSLAEDLLPVSGVLYGPDTAKYHGEPGLGECL